MHADGTTGSLAERTGQAFAAYRNGDPAAMADLVDATTGLLWHTARAQGLSSAAAEDVVQTTWLSLVRHQHSIEDPRAVGAAPFSKGAVACTIISFVSNR